MEWVGFPNKTWDLGERKSDWSSRSSGKFQKLCFEKSLGFREKAGNFGMQMRISEGDSSSARKPW